MNWYIHDRIEKQLSWYEYRYRFLPTPQLNRRIQNLKNTLAMLYNFNLKSLKN